jgi:hypothetical protein
MKNIILTLLLFFVSTLLMAQNLKALDDKYGFREMRFETPLDSLKNLVEVEKDYYKSTTEDMKLGDYELSQVVYNFYKGLLGTIMIESKGYVNSVGFLKILQEAYGKGYKDNPYIERYIWVGEKVKMSYKQNSITNGATIFIYSVKIDNLEKADEKKANSEAVKKL